MSWEDLEKFGKTSGQIGEGCAKVGCGIIVLQFLIAILFFGLFGC